MLSKREKEIIRNVYMAISKQVYTSSGPSYLSQTDHQEISNFLHQLENDKRTYYNYKNRDYNLFDGDVFCPTEKDCNNKSKQEGK